MTRRMPQTASLPPCRGPFSHLSWPRCKCPQGSGIFHLQVGYHMLDGKQVALKKPLAVMQSSEHGDAENLDSRRCFKVAQASPPAVHE